MAEEQSKDESAKKTKRPTPLKREMQNKRRRLANRARRSSISTAIRSLQSTITAAAPTEEKLNIIYSLVDKAVKQGLFKENKASRIKSRLTARARAV